MAEYGIPEPLFARFSERLADHMGLHFPRERWRDLDRGIKAACREFGFADAASCVEWLLVAPLSRRETEILASHLTVGETYFFRDKASFAGLEENILAPLIHARTGKDQRLRIWSAGCCTGEEAYSVAILLAKMIPDLKNWNITLLATDINPHFLKKASQGIYADWSFRETTPEFRQLFFRKTDAGTYRVPDHIRDMVTFSYLNLADDTFPSLENNTNAMDVILCRNVLMYFEPERARRITTNFHHALMNGGWLLVSPTETSQSLFSCLATVNIAGRTLYRKDNAVPATIEPPGTPEKMSRTPLASATRVRAAAGMARRNLDSPPPELPNRMSPSRSWKDATGLYEQGKYTEAAERIDEFLKQRPGDIAAMLLLVRINANQGRLDQALGICAKAIATDKLNPGCYYLQATILQEQGSSDKAVEALKRAIFLEPEFALAHFALGNLDRRRGKFVEAEKSFSNALALLKRYRREEILPESEGITAGRLEAILQSRLSGEVTA